MKTKPRVYIDSACFIGLACLRVSKESGLDDKDRFILESMLRAHSNGHIYAFTSMLTVAECTSAKGDISEEVQKLFRGVFESDRYVKLIQPSIFLAEDARELRWKYDISMRGADGLHVATAFSRKCSEFLTINGKLARLQGKKKLEELGLRVIRPQDTIELPLEYRHPQTTIAPTELPPSSTI